MKKQYITPLCETLVFRVAPLMEDASQQSLPVNPDQNGPQQLSNRLDYEDSWDDDYEE